LEFTSIIEKINAAGGVQKFELFGDKDAMQSMFAEVTSKGLLTYQYYESFFSFLIFWYFFSTAFIYVFSLLYYRKFVEK